MHPSFFRCTVTMPSKMRNACFTLNNYTDDDCTRLSGLAKCPDVSYCVIAKEIGESGTPHLQGYAEFSGSFSFSRVKALLGTTAHIEPRHGPQSRAISYCKKGDQPHDEWDSAHEDGYHYGANLDLLCEFGTPKSPGQRTDLDQVVTDIQAGKRLRDLAADHPIQFIKYSKGILSYRSALQAPRSSTTPKEVIVRFGDTGTGKTRQAWLDHPDAYVWGPGHGKWFDSYDLHTEVIFDEFRGQLPFALLLQLLDRYPMKVEYKGGMTEFVADSITITSPVHPVHWYSLSGSNGKIGQLVRRITKIYHHTGVSIPPFDVTDTPWPSFTESFADQFDSGGCDSGSDDPFSKARSPHALPH